MLLSDWSDYRKLAECTCSQEWSRFKMVPKNLLKKKQLVNILVLVITVTSIAKTHHCILSEYVERGQTLLLWTIFGHCAWKLSGSTLSYRPMGAGRGFDLALGLSRLHVSSCAQVHITSLSQSLAVFICPSLVWQYETSNLSIFLSSSCWCLYFYPSIHLKLESHQ